MLDGVYFVDVYDPDKPETKAFIAKYEKEFHEPPYSLPAYGYDAIRLVADVIKHAGSTNKGGSAKRSPAPATSIR